MIFENLQETCVQLAKSLVGTTEAEYRDTAALAQLRVKDPVFVEADVSSWFHLNKITSEQTRFYPKSYPHLIFEKF